MNGVVFFLLQMLHYLCKGMQLISVYWFCILTLYRNWLITIVYCLILLRFSVYWIIPANKDNFASFSLIWMPFIYLSCQIALARTFSTILNRNTESGHSCFVTDLRENTFNFSPLSLMLSMALSQMYFIMLRGVPPITTLLRVFIRERYFVKCFSCHYWNDHVILIFHFIDVVY